MSTLKVNEIQNTSGVEQYLVKAWVNFNGTGTVAIRASGNVSSITDNGTGDYTVNFTSAVPDANYGAAISVGGTAPVDITRANDQVTPRTTSVFRVIALNNGFALSDAAQMNVSIFR